MAAPPQVPPHQTAQSLLMMLRGSATRDVPAAEEAPATPAPSLLEELRASSAASPAPREGLLGLLAQPAVWDLPQPAPPPSGPAPLMGRPIVAPPPGGHGLLALPPGGFGAPPPPPAPAAQPAPAQPAPPPAPAGRSGAAAPAGSLAEMFRIVAAPPPAVAPPKPTGSLQDILRGLRPDRRD